MEDDNKTVLNKLGSAVLGSFEVVGTSLIKGAFAGDKLTEAVGNNLINLLNESRKNKKQNIGYAKIKLANGKYKIVKTKNGKIDLATPVDEAPKQFDQDKTVFEKILEDAAKRGRVPKNVSNSKNWFRQKAAASISSSKSYKDVLAKRNQDNDVDKAFPTLSISPGSMYFYSYDPKTKDELPYYDAFPLIFVVDYTANGFTGLNMHYLPPILRAKLMDALYTTATNKDINENTRLNLSYNMLKGASKFKYFQPCFKQYLFAHVRSKFYPIQPIEWDMALFLPWQQFRKASSTKVWSDSIRMIGK